MRSDGTQVSVELWYWNYQDNQIVDKTILEKVWAILYHSNAAFAKI